MKVRLRRNNLKDKLELKGKPERSTAPALGSPPESDASSELPAVPSAERVRTLARDAEADSVVFQSVAVAALKMLDRVRGHEQQAAAAALSLAQQEKLETMTASLEAVMQALHEALSTQGAKMFDLCAAEPVEEPEEPFWWFALTETIQAQEEGIAWLASMVQGQPKGNATRTLSSVIARLLRAHHNALLAEAEEWMS